MLKPVNNEYKIDLNNFCIDFGFNSKENAIESGIKIGDQINFVNNFQTIANNKIIAKSLDDRIGIAALVELATTIDKSKLQGDLYLCASVQEEVGLRGATTLINKLPDDLINVLIIDVSPITDIYDETSCRVGSGALIRIQDPGMIFNYEVVNQLRELAQVNNIAFQEFFSTGGTDSRVVEIAKSGHIVGAICIPARALHAQNTVASIDDINAACNLATAYIYDVIGG
jgi:putative aminopeptidase FrvX